MRVAINGFGRIGRAVFKIALDRGVNVVAVNDVHGIKDALYLLKYDSVYGNYDKNVKTSGDSLIVDGKKVKVLTERDPSKLPWKKLGVDVVVESTGVFTKKKDACMHFGIKKGEGAKKVLVTAPCKEGKPDLTVIPGVNHDKLKKNHDLLSVASCTSNCLIPITKIIHEKFGIKNALMSTVHAYTTSQGILDGSNEKDARRGRAAALNIIPTTTGAIKSLIEVMPELQGKVNGLSLRVPIACGSITDLVAEVKKSADVEKVNSAFRAAAKGKMKGIVQYSEDELVSSDIIANPHSAIVDSISTEVSGNLVKVLAWYDNEYGYSHRVVDVLKIIKRWIK